MSETVPDAKAALLSAISATKEHAADLIACSGSVLAGGYPHIAYHLATLALEEVGRHELLSVETISSAAPVPPAWPIKHTQDHIQKLFWAFFGGFFHGIRITSQELEAMKTLAEDIHATRLAGLYVGLGQDGVEIPRRAVSEDQAKNLINVAQSRLDLARLRQPVDEPSSEDVERQRWFLRMAEDPEMRRQAFSRTSLNKLAELADPRAWADWLKQLFDERDAANRSAAEAELRRTPGDGDEDKWLVRVRVMSESHVIRPRVLNEWNDHNDWIKLSAVGGRGNNWLQIELRFRDDVPVLALWPMSYGIVRALLVALNLGTMGYWWWNPVSKDGRFYERIEDLATKSEVVLTNGPPLKMNWEQTRPLSGEELRRVAVCMSALPGPEAAGQVTPYDHYIGGLTMLSLNDVHWRTEANAFAAFFHALRGMMMEMGKDASEEKAPEAFLDFLDEGFPSFDERNAYQAYFRAVAAGTPPQGLSIKEAIFMKLFCDAYFLRFILPMRLTSKGTGLSESGN
jgi:AbiV family abortive infection protein